MLSRATRLYFQNWPVVAVVVVVAVAVVVVAVAVAVVVAVVVAFVVSAMAVFCRKLNVRSSQSY